MKNSNYKDNMQNRRRDDVRQPLDSSLGSFGIDPPKRYRREEPEEEPRRRRPVKKEEKRRLWNIDERRAAENKQRKRNKKLRQFVLNTTLVVSVVVVLAMVFILAFCKISNVTIQGNKQYAVDEISAVLPIEKGDNLIFCDTKKASRKLAESLPYIYRAEIKRKLPSKLVVNITETPTVYGIKNADKSFTLLDNQFKVLETGAKKKQGMIEIRRATLKTANVGQPAVFTNEKIQENLKMLIQAIADERLDNVTAVYSADINNNYLVFDKRITVKLGTLENLTKKIDSALSAMEKLSESNPQAEGTLTVTDAKRAYFSENE